MKSRGKVNVNIACVRAPWGLGSRALRVSACALRVLA